VAADPDAQQDISHSHRYNPMTIAAALLALQQQRQQQQQHQDIQRGLARSSQFRDGAAIQGQIQQGRGSAQDHCQSVMNWESMNQQYANSDLSCRQPGSSVQLDPGNDPYL